MLGRLGKLDGILKADPPFEDEAGIVLPLEYFESITLATWVERYAMPKKARFEDRIGLWLDIAAAIADAHDEGVVHRLLRPEVILVQDTPKPTEIRITGFDLAKQLARRTWPPITPKKAPIKVPSGKPISVPLIRLWLT